MPNPANPQSWNRYAYTVNNPIKYKDPSGHCFEPVSGAICALGFLLIGSAFVLSGTDQMRVASQQPSFWHEQQAAQDWRDNCMGVCHRSDAAPSRSNTRVGGPRPPTPAMDSYGEGMADAVIGTMMVVDSTIYLTRSAFLLQRPVTVRHYTDNASKVAITESKGLRSGSYITKPSEVNPRAGHLQIEELLEIKPGRGTNYIDVDVPRFKLRTPNNGATTSGGAWQRQILGETKIDKFWWRRPPGRPISE